MAFVRLIIVPLLVVAGPAQAAWLCTENSDPRFASLRPRTSVMIQELANLTDRVPQGKTYDSAYAVDLQIETSVGGVTEVVKKVRSVATLTGEDYVIEDPELGIHFWTVLNEFEQSGIEYSNEDGVTIRKSLTCSQEDFQ